MVQNQNMSKDQLNQVKNQVKDLFRGKGIDGDTLVVTCVDTQRHA